jgi:hypothetical protein
MPEFTAEQKEWAKAVLAGEHNGPLPGQSAGGEGLHGTPAFLQLQAKVIQGELRVDDHHNDWVVARQDLTAAEQADLRKLLGWDDA